MSTSSLATLVVALYLHPEISHRVRERLPAPIVLTLNSIPWFRAPAIDNHQVHVNYLTKLIARTSPRIADRNHLAKAIVSESLKAGYDPLFVAAVVKSESTFNRKARSRAGATGLMQLRPSTGLYISRLSQLEWRGHGGLTDPQYNVRLGIAYLKYLEKMYRGNRERVLVAYNWGPGNLSKALSSGQGVPRGPTSYARGIIKNHTKWRAEVAQLKSSLGLA